MGTRDRWTDVSGNDAVTEIFSTDEKPSYKR